MILDRWRMRAGFPAVEAPAPRPPLATKQVLVHDVDGDRWASCSRCPWTSNPDRELGAQVRVHESAVCG